MAGCLHIAAVAKELTALHAVLPALRPAPWPADVAPRLHTLAAVGSFALFLSCALAVLVNVSQFMCLGRFSAVSFQVRALLT